MTAPGFVGREREMAALASALSGPAAVVLLEGGAGAGKSRLVREFLSSAEGRRVRSLVVWCPPYREPYTLGPIVDAVRQATDSVSGLSLSGLAGALRPLFPEWVPQLPPAPEALGDAKTAQHRIFRALAELLDRLGVAVLVVEDVHWADDATLEFLLFLASRQPPLMSVVVTFRAADVPDDSLLLRLSSRPQASGRRLVVNGLDVAQTARLVSSMLDGEPVSVDFAEFLHRHTDGIPLAVEESVRLLYDRGALVRQGGKWVCRRLAEIEVPATIRDAVLERVARLGPAAQAVLRAAAVLTDGADDAALAVVSGLSVQECGPGLDEALGSGLLADVGGMLSFRHALSCRAIYDTIPVRERRAMHLRASQLLVDRWPVPVARLAEHFRAAGQAVQWRHYAEQAADLALASSDEVSAGNLLFDVLTGAAPSADDTLRLVRKFPFEVFSGPTRFGALVAVLRRTLDGPDLPLATEAAVRRQLSRVLILMEEYEAGRAEAERAIATGALEPLEAARCMRSLSSPDGNTWHKSVHLRWLARAHALTTQHTMSAVGRLWSDVGRMGTLLLLGEESGWAEAATFPDRSSVGEEAGPIAAGNLNIGDSGMVWGRYGEAARRLAAAATIADEHEYVRLRDIVEATQLHLDWFTGAWDGLAERAAAVVGNEDMQPLTRREANLVAGLVHSATGEVGRAEAEFRVVLAEAQRRQAGVNLPEPAGALAELYLADGRVADALRVTDGPMDLIARKGVWLRASEIAPVRVRALLAAGRPAEAAELVAGFAEGLRDCAAPAAHAALALCRAILAETDAAAYAWAAAAWAALPRPYDALLARERQAHCLLVEDPDAGQSLLTEVFHGLADLGARAAAERVEHRLRECGVDLTGRGRRGRRGYGDQLSPRELEVVQLVATGMTNREVARTLSRSPKTVSSQLASAMRKLDVSSRTALAMRAAAAGLLPGDPGAAAGGPETAAG